MPTREFRLVGFDGDYTLLDPRPGRKAALEALFAESGIALSVTGALAHELYARGADYLIPALLAGDPETFGGLNAQQVRERFVALEHRHAGETILMPGALDAFHGSLGRNTIISRSPTDLLMVRTQAALDNALAGRTDGSTADVPTKVAAVQAFLAGEQQKLEAGERSVLVAADSLATGRGKPFPDPITAAFTWLSEVLGLPYEPRACLFVGDSNEDTYAGILAGVTTVRAQVSDGVLSDVFRLPDTVREHITVPTLAELTLLRAAGGDVMLRTDAEVREVDLAEVWAIVTRLLGESPDSAREWPQLDALPGEFPLGSRAADRAATPRKPHPRGTNAARSNGL